MKSNKKYYKNGWIIACKDVQHCRVRKVLDGDSSLEQGYRDAIDYIDSGKVSAQARKIGLDRAYDGFDGQKSWVHISYA